MTSTDQGLSGPKLLGVLNRTLPLLWRSAQRLVSLLAAVQMLSGLMPALTVLIGRWTVDGLTA